jgi:hypothetical protein
VQIGSVRLRFLPPGFEVEDVVVFDNPEFGSEPLLRAPDVNASVRLLALLRGHIEISRLNLSESSLNLTRDLSGRWNIEDLIARTSHSSLAPTGAARRIAGPAFPYIEATDARVNFKLGTEKIHFALTGAEFSLWQESADTWGARIQARPIRTDANLTDTGILTASGLWRRAPEVHQTPVQISLQWKNAQIGQLSRLVYGNDKGWRGGTLLSGTITGTPEHLRISADGAVDDLRRQDVIGGGQLRLAAHCAASYNSAAREIADLDCAAPIENGYMQLKGGAAGLLLNGEPFATSDLWLVVSHAPMQSFITALRHANLPVADTLAANGDVSASIQIARADAQAPISIEGKGSVDGLRISRGDSDSVEFDSVPLSLSNSSEQSSARRGSHLLAKSSLQHSGGAKNGEESRQLRLEAGPMNLASGKLGPLTGEATFIRSGYAATAQGETGVKRLLLISRALGLPAPATGADGVANVNLRVTGSWGERSIVTGTAHLHSVRAEVRGLNAPIDSLSADLTVEAESVAVQNLSAKVANTNWHGSMRIPRPCPFPGSCQLQFKLHTAELSTSALNKLFNPAARSRSWYKFLSLGNDQPSYLLRARAVGKISIDKLTLGTTSCTKFASDLRLEAGKLSLSDFSGNFMDGTATGKWEAEFASNPPRYQGSGDFTQVSLENLSELMHNGWIDGSGGAKYEFEATGRNLQELLASASLKADFDITGGSFPHVVLAPESGPLQIRHFSGTLQVSDGALSFTEAKLTTLNEVYTVSGTASLTGALSLKAVSENNGGYAIGGTLVKTKVSAIPNAEASLKP